MSDNPSRGDADSDIDLKIDEEKIEAWDEVKDDYAVDPDNPDVPDDANDTDVPSDDDGPDASA